MSMPQYLTVAVISCRPLVSAEVAVATTSLLNKHEQGIQPNLVAVALSDKYSWRLTVALNSREVAIIRPQLPAAVDPKSVDLWLAADDEGGATALARIDEAGSPPPKLLSFILWRSSCPVHIFCT